MHRTKIDICTLCVGFCLKEDRTNDCLLLRNKNFHPSCPCNNDAWYQKKVVQFDEFIAEQTEAIKELFQKEQLQPEEIIELIYELVPKEFLL